MKLTKIVVIWIGLTFCAGSHALDAPPAETFRVLPPFTNQAPTITPYLRYQTEMAWHQDELRQARWQQVKTEEDLKKLQEELRTHLLQMIGGLPKEKTPLHPKITGRAQLDGFRVEKLIFESLPGVYVTAVVYVPDHAAGKNPAVLVPAGHSPNGKAYYQALCQRLVQRGYVVLSWDPVGQGERSQFWDARKKKSRYNLICAEHAVLGNLAYLAGTNLARWEIWDGIRAVDYLLTRPEVDPGRISITGTSGGGFQAIQIAALDGRIKVVAPSCYITALPMRVFNRIFKDPDSDPEQDLDGMISQGLDHAGLVLLMYPRPVFVAAAVLDFFPIEGTHKTFQEVKEFYARFGHADRIAMRESYNEHQYSLENQEAAMEFLDYFNRMPVRHALPVVKEVDTTALQCTRTGQVTLDFDDARSIMDLVRDYYFENKSQVAPTLKQLYYATSYPGIQSWSVAEYHGGVPGQTSVQWELVGTSSFRDVTIDRYLLHHSRYLTLPLLRIHKAGSEVRPVLFWIGENGKATSQDWPTLAAYLEHGFDIISIDPRGQGETRMPYKAVSPDDPSLGQASFDEAYISPISGVLADYVYNSLLTGRPYLLQMIEDVEIATIFARAQFGPDTEFSIAGEGDAYTLARAASETLPNVKLHTTERNQGLKWSEIVNEKRELWPIKYLLPGGAYVH